MYLKQDVIPCVVLLLALSDHVVLRHEDVPLVEFIYVVFTHMPGESYRRRLRSLLITPLCVDCARALWASFCFKFVSFMSVFVLGGWCCRAPY